MATEPIIVQAIHNFKGNNNDELNLTKGDLITITQKDEGWWEGTLNGKTGWFPSNYVKECKDAPKPIIHQQSQYKAVVLKDLIDSEKAHVTELEGLMTMFLHPLQKSTILTEDEYKQLTGNIGIVLETHQQLLQLLEIESTKNGSDQRVGRLFLNWAPKIKNIHQTYCALHPKAVCIIDKHKDELNKYMESRGASSPGVLVLTTMLSKPFRRLDKYSGMLKELERHIEECHPDRGDTQRSVAVYKDIATTCTATRRQKELELQVLTGPIRDLEGPPLSTLGDIIYMGSVAFGPHHHDRYFVLFPSTLVILSVSHRLSAFIYEGRLILSSVTVTRLEDTDQLKNAFEISSPMIDRKLVICQSKDEANRWVELIRRSAMGGRERIISQTRTPPPPPPHQLNQRGYSIRASVITFQPQIDYTPSLPPINYPSAAPYASLTKMFSKLIKSKKITSKLLKQLLYSEYLNKMNLSLVKIRHHKSECYIRTRSHYRDSVIHCESDSETGSSLESDSESDSETCSRKRDIRRQNAVYSASNKSSSSSDDDDNDDDSNPFGYIRYYNPNKATATEKHESFIDYGIVTENPSPRMVPDTRSQDKKSIVCTSSVNVLLKQCSEESSVSSNFQSKPSFAYENLTNLHDSTELKMLNVPKQIYIPTTRQSCPTKFVGNRFNQTSLTTIYIPTPSNSDNDLSLQESKVKSLKKRESDDSNNSNTTHSTSLEVPVNVVPLPDKILAEILYNNDEVNENTKSSSFDSDFTQHSGKTVIKPPKQFANDEDCEVEDKKANLSISKSSVSLNLENIGFRKHSINSDKPKSEQLKRRRSIHIFPNNDLSSPSTSRRTDLPNRGAHGNDFCKCCMEYSPRSSDSGMAGSCTLNSPDLMNDDEDDNVVQENYDNFLEQTGIFHEMEAKDYESQCQCTSPFGSTPRTSCQDSLIDQTNLLRISQASFDSSSDPHTVDLIKTRMHSQESVGSNNSSGGGGMGAQKSKSESNLLDNVKEETEEQKDQPIYRSGLYAHWWLKAKIPVEVIRGIYEETRQNNTQTGKGYQNEILMSPLMPTTSRGSKLNQSQTKLVTPPIQRSGASSMISNPPNVKAKSTWSASRLRPRPPQNPCLAYGMSPGGAYGRKQQTDYKDDSLILEVIEAYSSGAKPRNTINSANISPLPTAGPKSDLSKRLDETIQAMQAMQLRLGVLENNVKGLTVQISEEREARCALQKLVRNYIINNPKDLKNTEWTTMESNI